MSSILKGFGLHSSKRKGHRPTLFDRSPGQAIVLIAVLMVVLLGFTGLAVDGGELYFLQKNVQNAADAAVMAGLYEICSDPSRTLDAAHDAALLSAEQAINDNGFYDVDGITADGITNADMSDGLDIVIIHPANPTDPTNPANPGPGLTSNYFVLEITASKPARLIQLVYQGPLQVTVRAAGKCTPVAEWTQGKALFGIGTCNAPKESVVFTGSSVNVVGGVFGNGDVNVNSSGSGDNIIDGGVGSAGTTNDHNKIDYTNPSTGQPANNQQQVVVPQFWDLRDFRPGGKTANWAANLSPNAYFAYTTAGGDADQWSDFSPNPIDANGDPKDGIYYSAGSITLAHPDLTKGGNTPVDMNGITFVAADTISLQDNANNLMVAFTVPFSDIVTAGYDKLPLAFTEFPQPEQAPDCNDNTRAIDIGSQFAFLGAIYAPNGQCGFSGSSGQSSQGALLCYVVNLSGSSFTITYDPDVFPPPPPSVGLTNP